MSILNTLFFWLQTTDLDKQGLYEHGSFCLPLAASSSTLCERSFCSKEFSGVSSTHAHTRVLPVEPVPQPRRHHKFNQQDSDSHATHGHSHVLPSSNVASSDTPFLPMDIHVLPLNAAHSHSLVTSFERCSQRQPYRPMDIHVLPSFLKLPPATALSALGHSGVLPPFAHF
jgi:hypothetical protein